MVGRAGRPILLIVIVHSSTDPQSADDNYYVPQQSGLDRLCTREYMTSECSVRYSPESLA